MSEAEKRRKDRQELNELLHAIEPAKNEDIAKRAIGIADYWLIKAENQAKHIQDLEARNSKQPTIESERKTGTWYEHYSHEDGERDGVRCSECGTHYYFGGQLMNYCPNCGADMKEGEADGQR